jgi:mercuric ion binding protein
MLHLLIASTMVLMAAPALAETITIRIDGMVCAFCAKGIEQLFTDETVVERVQVDIDQGQARITTKGDGTLSDARIKELVNEAGYDAATITRAP